MRIRFIPPSPRAGELVHIENQTGRTLIASGFAEEVKYTSYHERLREEGNPTPDTSAATFIAPGTVLWSVHEPVLCPTNPITIKRTDANGTQFFDGIPDESKWGKVPDAVKAKYASLVAERSGERPAFDKEAAEREQYEQKERERKATYATLYGKR